MYTQKQNQSKIEFCKQNDTEECYKSMFELLIPRLLLKKVKVPSESSELIKIDYLERWDSKYAMEKSEAIIGYGVFRDVRFESAYRVLFDNPAYCFDCSVTGVNIYIPDVFFYSECIGTDEFILASEGLISSKKIHLFDQKLKELNLNKKNIFLKIDINGAEVEVLPEILKKSEFITGIDLVFYLHTTQDLIKMLPILDELNKNFSLVSRAQPFYKQLSHIKPVNTRYYNKHLPKHLMYVSYINNNIVEKNSISWEQNTKKYKEKLKAREIIRMNKDLKINSDTDVSFVVTLVEKCKELVNKVWKTQH